MISIDTKDTEDNMHMNLDTPSSTLPPQDDDVILAEMGYQKVL